MPAPSLHGVSAGLVKRLPRGDIRLDIICLQVVKAHPSAYDVTLRDAQGEAHDSHPGQHHVLAPAQAAQHGVGRRGIRRLAENALVQHHNRVGAQHPRRRELSGHMFGFGARQTRDVGLGTFRGVRPFINVRRQDAERQ